MRFDKPRYFRQSMSWVHTWTGLVLGWLLFAIYVTGTLAYFRNEITLWMQPELHVATTTVDDSWLPKAVNLLMEKGGNAQQWTITPPGPRSFVVGLSYREVGQGRAGEEGGRQLSTEDRHLSEPQASPSREASAGRSGNVEMRSGSSGEVGQRQQGGQQQDKNQGLVRLMMDPSTGEVLEPRTTAGGNFLYRFHYQLHGMDRSLGQWIVGIATMLMFIAIITGVIVHRNIFKDFFTFRLAKGKRSWLDGHNASGVLSLPFHILITFSGLLLLATQLMPWAVDAVYDGDRSAFNREVRGINANANANTNTSREEGGGRQAKTRTGRGGEQVVLTDLRPLYQQALQQWSDLGVGNIIVNNPGKSQQTVEIRQAFGKQLTARGGAERMLFSGVTGESLDAPVVRQPSLTRSIWNVFVAVHEGRFATSMVRWMLFLSGVLGSLMIASGLVLWLVSRQKKCEAQGRLPGGHRFVQVMNVGAVSGLMIATAAYFWANRLIPGDLGNRNEQEILSFFVVWGLCFVHALIRSHKNAWIEQLWVGAALFLLLPLLNGLTGGAHLGRSIQDGQWQVAGFDLAALVTGAALLFIAHKVRLYVPKPARKDISRAEASGNVDDASEVCLNTKG